MNRASAQRFLESSTPVRRSDLIVHSLVALCTLILGASGALGPIENPATMSYFLVGVATCILFWPMTLGLQFRVAISQWIKVLIPSMTVGAIASWGLSSWIVVDKEPYAVWLTRICWGAIVCGASAGTMLSWQLSRRESSLVRSIQTHFWSHWISVPLFIFSTGGGVIVVMLLSPTVYDAHVYWMDKVFWDVLTIPASFAIPAQSVFFIVLKIVYELLPAILLISAAPLFFRHRLFEFRRAILGFTLIGYCGWLCYITFPVVGPLYFLPTKHASGQIEAEQFTRGNPRLLERFKQLDDDRIAQRHATVFPAPVLRNCMPSLHTAWSLLCWIIAAHVGRRFFMLISIPVVLTIASTVILGYHYVTDLLLAIPYTAVVWVIADRVARKLEGDGVTHSNSASSRRELLFLALLTLLLIGSFIALPLYRIDSRIGYWSIYLVLTAPILVLSYRLTRFRSSRAEATPISEPIEAQTPASNTHDRTPKSTKIQWAIMALFFSSGFTGLLYEVAFEQQLALLFGSTAVSTTTVLATYMAGLALGARIGGQWTDRLSQPLRAYAIAELVIGIVCLAAPFAFLLTERVYVLIASSSPLSGMPLTMLRVACGALVLFVPALLMGTTMPFLMRHITHGLDEVQSNVGLLYSANTLGAALGTVSTAYLLLPTLGRSQTILIATAINFCVAYAALRLCRRASASEATASSAEKSVETLRATKTESVVEKGVSSTLSWLSPRALIAAMTCLALLIGFVTFGLEVCYVHLLALVAGNSTYVFALMLFSFLLGLGGGSWIATKWSMTSTNALTRLAVSQALLGVMVLSTIGFWEEIPAFFASFSTVQFARTFAEREFVRFTVCLTMMIGPTLLIGFSFPHLVAITSTQFHKLGRSVGIINAMNTIGNILGALLVGFVLLPAWGSYRAITALGTMSLLIGLALFFFSASSRLRVVGTISVALCLLGGWMALPQSFTAEKLTTGANVYFSPQPYGPVIDIRESMEGGFTSVHRRVENGAQITTLLTNGKFQGDDGPEMGAQHLFAIYPLLHRGARDNVLVIGLGTGVSAGTFLAAGFQRIAIAELAPEISEFAKRYFSHVNHRVLTDPRATLHHTDGRNLLLLSKERYGVISIEISSIWFSGASVLYNEEFYRLAALRLTSDGVLQQWVQLHHISLRDLVAIFVSARKSFPYLYFYFSGVQGVLLGAQHPIPIDAEQLKRLESDAQLRPILDRLPLRTVLALPGQLLLTPTQMDRFLKQVAEQNGVEIDELGSTDDNMFLAYSTPKGNVRGYAESTRMNVHALMPFQTIPDVVSSNSVEKQVIDAAIRIGMRQAPTQGAFIESDVPDWLRESARRLRLLK